MYGSPVGGVTPSITDIRVRIGDQPRLCVLPGQYELIAAPADGVSTDFGLIYRKAILSTLAVFTAVLPAEQNAAPPVYVELAANDAYTPWSGTTNARGLPVVRFAPTPPAAGTLVGAQYDIVMFTDAEIATYIPDNLGPTVTNSLARIQYAMIPAILADRDALKIVKTLDRVDDVAAWQAGLRALRLQLKADIDEDPGAGPSGSMTSYRDGGYGYGGGYGGGYGRW